MEIISISLEKDELDRLNIIQNNLGFTSRSKMLRSTIESLLNEFQTIESITDNNEVVLIITYKENEK
jgi:metal-responsive CopG/Arc/MetJ family transcriptional regulator